MSATAGAIIGLSLLTAGAVFAYFKFVEPGLQQNLNATQTNISVKSQQWVDPNGPEVQFILFTRNNTPYRMKTATYDALNKSGFDPKNPTKIITHGFLSNIENDVFTLCKDAYLDTGDYNVIGMDWSALSQSEYISAIRGAKAAGQQLGDFINYLALNGVALTDLHLIGHSLGAHVAAMGADSVQGGRVGRITGLDPANPGYGDVKNEMKLDPQDAKLVDVVHTYLRVIGAARPLGHVDFYPNGGKYQPGCPDIISFTESIYCNHGRSYELFAESIRNPKAFKSKRCKGLEDALSSRCLEETDVFMGQEETYKYGLFYFKTRGFSPYSINSNGIG